MRRSVTCAASLVLVGSACLLGPRPVAAQTELQLYMEAEASFGELDYGAAVTRFERLLGLAGEPPILETRGLVLEARKYLGASYVMIGQPTAAEAQFLELLREDPSYQLDPRLPQAVQTTFGAVQRRLEEERDAAVAEEARRRRERAAQLLRQQATLIELRRLASEVEVQRENSRWVAAIPFGIGQFQNGHAGLGWFLLVAEAATVITSAVTFGVHQSILNQAEEGKIDDIASANDALDRARILNWISVATFGALLTVGVVDAQIRFVPRVAGRTRTRQLPQRLLEDPVLEPDPEEPVRVEATVGPGTGLGIRVLY